MTKGAKLFRYRYTFEVVSPRAFERDGIEQLADMAAEGAVVVLPPVRVARRLSRAAAVRFVGEERVREIEEVAALDD